MTTCERKTRYESEGKAWKAAVSARARTREVIQHYFCSHCSGWHIGHAPLRALRRRIS